MEGAPTRIGKSIATPPTVATSLFFFLVEVGDVPLGQPHVEVQWDAPRAAEGDEGEARIEGERVRRRVGPRDELR